MQARGSQSPAGCKCKALAENSLWKNSKENTFGSRANESDWVGIALLLVLCVASERGLAPPQNPTKASKTGLAWFLLPMVGC